MIDSQAARLDSLETHISHQDRMIEELNEVVLAQREDIRRLERRIDKLMSRVATLEDQAPLPENTPPPHY
ncbi:MAG: SlyX protein [Oceanicaulis sp.]|uniref:Protein SlyX homolog n=1 Tax=Maricaulis virginensis TaxID=144022 RepID=A0A9W6IPT6_9PROT|nr:SlyX family protein [Maricaulis virginensis]MAC39628.1 SlyX protein [Oceanicaulis sp.]MAZ91181.1 SlyX protein [Maricaulis sp.]MBI75000.1 SlyX protein [Oceanicaulis sp.]GLK53389.1 hypothetical protein GCM10017621_28970 [Maricaulis virginensis]